MTRISINLLGVERKEALQRKGINVDKGILGSVGMIAVAAVIVLILNMVLTNMVAQATDQKTQKEAKIKELDAKLEEIKTLEAQRKNLLMEEKILRYVTGETYKWSYMLQEVRALMPLDVVIKDLKFSADNSFVLTGTATDHRSVALFLANLQNSKMLTEATLQSSTKASDKTGATAFVISCKKAG